MLYTWTYVNYTLVKKYIYRIFEKKITQVTYLEISVIVLILEQNLCL